MTGSDAFINTQNQLSDASMEALGLQHQPFVDAIAGGELFSDATTTSLLTDINTALYGTDDVLLVLGIEGSGRSTLLRQLAASQKSRIACFSVKGSPRFDTAHLFGSVLEAFKTPVPGDLKDALDALIPNLQGTFERYNRLSTIVLDDAEQVPAEELTKLLSSALYLNGHEEPLLRVLLAGTPEFEDKLPDALPQGAEIRYASLNIEPFDNERAENYLEFRLNQVGYFDEFPFTDSDTQIIMEESAGFPGHINQAAALNLNAQHGQLPDSVLPPELVEKRAGGNLVKMLLGGFACLLILAGLFMFTKNDGERSPAAKSGDSDYRTVETVAVSPVSNSNAQELEIVNTTGDTANQLATNTTDVLSQNTAANETPQTDVAPAEVSADSANGATEAASSASSQSAPEPAPTLEPVPAAEPEPTPTPEPEPAAEPEPEPSPAPNSDEDLLADDSDSDNVEPAATPAAEPSAQTSAQSNPEASGVLESPTWILVQDPQKYTVQMSASTDKASVESFMRRNDLPPPNSVFAFDRNGATWYALVHGLYDSVPEARDALKLLPEGALRNQPWIRRISQIQGSLKDQN